MAHKACYFKNHLTVSILIKLCQFCVINLLTLLTLGFTTNKYKYNLYALMTGVKFILLTSVSEIDYSELLRTIHSDIFLEFIQKNTLSEIN